MATVRSHSYKPTPQFIGNPRGKVYFGVELELDIDGYDRSCGDCNDCLSLQKEAANKSEALLGDFVYYKRDGSINGVELVSHPCSLSGHRRRWKPFMEEMPDVFKVSRADGLHVHASKGPLTKDQIWEMHNFINNTAPKEWLEKLAGRNFNEYARHIKKSKEQLGHNIVGKYEAVNVLPRDTVEFRLFASTTDFSVLMYRLEFVAALVQLVRTATTAPSRNGLEDWVHGRPKVYPQLDKYFRGL